MSDRVKVEGGVLAEGEATGHAHRVPVEVERSVFGGTRYFTTTEEEIEVIHEEHAPIALPPRKKMASAVVREFDYVYGRMVNVAD